MIVFKIFLFLLLACMIVLGFVGVLISKPFRRGFKPLYPIDNTIKWNLSGKKIRIIEVNYVRGSKEMIFYQIWERKLFIFSVRYLVTDYMTLEEAKAEVQNIVDYVELETIEKDII